MKALVLNRVSLVLALAGVVVSGVLSVEQLFMLEIPCGASHGCDIIAQDPSSHALGIPNAYLGLLAYLVLVVTSIWRLARPWARFPLMLGFAVTALGTLGSMVLTYYSWAVIHATCPWCLSSAIIMTLSVIVHAGLMQVGTPPPHQMDPVPGSDAPYLRPAGQNEPRISNVVFGAIFFIAAGLSLGVLTDGILKEAHAIGGKVDTKTPIAVYIPADAHIYGNPDAPITIIEFGDLLCPACQLQYGKIHSFIASHPKAVRYVFREFPLFAAKGHEQSAPAAVIGEIAAEKGLFWHFVDAMYAQEREGVKDTQPILDIAKSVGLDPKTCLDRIRNENDPAFKRMKKDMDDGFAVGVQGTPTFFLAAKGVKGVRQCTMYSLWRDLDAPPYTQYYK